MHESELLCRKKFIQIIVDGVSGYTVQVVTLDGPA